MEYKPKSRRMDDSLLRVNRQGSSVQRSVGPDISYRRAPLLPKPHVSPRQLRLQRTEKQLTDFTVSPMVAQRQALAPMLEGLQLQRAILNTAGPSSHLQSLQRQIENHQTQLSVSQLQAGQYEAAMQRQADLQTPVAPLTQRPNSPAQWSQGGQWEVQRVAHPDKPRQTISLREQEQSQHLGMLRTVGMQLGQGFRTDTGPATQRYAEYGAALAPFQRLGTGTGRAVVTTALMQVPASQRMALQRAIDQTIQRQQAQETQDRAIIGLHSLQRQLDHLEAQGEQPLMERIQARRGAGEPLSASLKKALELGLNHDLGAVRIHDDAEADHLARKVNAVAFTTGQDVFFRAGTFDPNTRTGVELIAHEVTHTVQQAQGKAKPGIDADAGLETEARAKGREMASRPILFGRPGGVSSGVQSVSKTPVSAHPSVQRLGIGKPLSGQNLGHPDPLLRDINAVMRLKLKAAQELYPLLKTSVQSRQMFFGGLYPRVPPTSELGRLLAASKVPLVQAYVQSMALHAKGTKWDAFPEPVKRLFVGAGVKERVDAIEFFGGKADPLEIINAQLGLKFKPARALYSILRSDAMKRQQFFQGLYSTVSPTSELGRLLASSKVPLIQAYVQGLALRDKGKKWDDFPETVKRLFQGAGIQEKTNAIGWLGGKASLLIHRFGGMALVKGNSKNVEVVKEVRFNAIGTFPKGLSFQQAKSQFLAKTTSIWSNTHKLIINDPKNTEFHQEFPIKVVVRENKASNEVINIYGSNIGRSNASGTTVNIYVHNEYGLLESEFALVAAHEAGHFILGARDEYKDVIDPKTKVVTGAKSTTHDNSVMANFYDSPKQAVSQPRLFSELLSNFKAMYPGKKVSIK